MCGLYSLTIAPEAMRAAFGLAEAVDYPPRAVIRPSEPVFTIRRDRDGLRHAYAPMKCDSKVTNC